MDIDNIPAIQDIINIKDEDKIDWTSREKKLASVIQVYLDQWTNFEKRLKGQEFLVQKWQELKNENESLKQRNYASEQSLRDAQDKLKVMVQEPKKALHIFYDRSVMRVLDSYIAENKTLKEQVTLVTGYADGPQLLQRVKTDQDLIKTLQKQAIHTEEQVSILRSIIDSEEPNSDTAPDENSGKNETIREKNRKILRLKKKVMNLADNNRQLQQRCVNQAQLIATETGVVRHLQAKLQQLVVDFRKDFESVFEEHGRDISQFMDDDPSQFMDAPSKNAQGSLFDDLFAPDDDQSSTNSDHVQALEAENKHLRSQVDDHEQTIKAMQERIEIANEELAKKDKEREEQVKLLNQLSRMEQSALRDKTLLQEEVESWRAAVQGSQSDAEALQQHNAKLEKEVQGLKKELEKWQKFREKGCGSQTSSNLRDANSRTSSYSNDTRRENSRSPSPPLANDVFDVNTLAPMTRTTTRLSNPSLQEAQRYQAPREPWQQSLPWASSPHRQEVVVADGGSAYTRDGCESADDEHEVIVAASAQPSNSTETFRCEFCHRNYPYPTIMQHLKSCRDRVPSE